MKGFFKRLGDFWTITGITFLLIVFIELFFRIYAIFVPSSDPRVQADCYGEATWVEPYYEEFAKCSYSTWEPYVYWKREPFTGEYINVDIEGHRRTVLKSIPLSTSRLRIKVFFLGGSSMWGSGVRDAYTLPSLVGNGLIREGWDPQVTNFGESGYVSTQEVIRLIQELKSGNIPDIVVFYDGVNDVFSSYQSGIAGIPQNEKNRTKEFNTLQEKKKAMLNFFRSLNTLATVEFVRDKFASADRSIPPIEHTDLSGLAENTVQVYNENIRLVNALAEQYGFIAVFYWQPTLFNKTSTSDYEKEELEKAAAIRPVFEDVRTFLFERDLHFENIHFYNLSGFFRIRNEPLFIDWCHVGENANVMLADRILNDILPMADSLKTKTPDE